jgi:FKBP-type peptidyl-prolyl cis-trans isomerase SlyD
MKITNNCVVSINFKLLDEHGALLDASEEGTPLIYLHGAAGIVPGLERELEGKAVGESFGATLTPEDGFGESNPELIQAFPLSTFPDPSQLQTGAQVQGTGSATGEVTNFVVLEITEEHVLLDSNHPLAGKTLCFEGTVHEVREATDEEISQGNPL